MGTKVTKEKKADDSTFIRDLGMNKSIENKESNTKKELLYAKVANR